MIQEFVTSINPSFNKWEELNWILMAFKSWEVDPAEPPSSGAFLCAANSSDLAAGCTAFFACSGDKHLPFEKCIKQFYKKHFSVVAQEKFKYGFGHPVFDQDPRVIAYFEKFGANDWHMSTAKKYVDKGNTPCLNFAGLFGIWCVENGFDERAAILPLMSRLLGLCELYAYNKSLPSSNECLNLTRIPSGSKG